MKNRDNVKIMGGMKTGLVIIGGACLVIVIIIGLMFGLPLYSVWQQGLAGQADLAKAEQTRKVLIAQAHAEMEAAELRAKAIAIVGDASKKYPEYRQQEFIGAFAHALESGKINQIIYVPTEANIPIIEAGHRPVQESQKGHP